MKHTLRYFSSILLLVSSAAFSQGQATDSIPVAPIKNERYGLRLGVDLYRLARPIYDDNFSGIEIVGDYRYNKKFYIAAEAGFINDYTVTDEQVNFTTKGGYLKIGFDYNAYENWLDMENMIYAGIRYGFGNFSQNLNSYTIYDTSDYFEEVTIYPDREYSGLTAHWAEVVGGIKVEILDNLYLGFSLRLNILLSEKQPDNFANLYIPGFNRTYEGNFGAGFNYTLSYFIPLYKKAAAPKETK
ncbi:MAG TPA: DUF6048 family protein [Flavobacterium sp.]|nr:DUF6048 family protein [Flavobacterium sp.]